MTKKISKISKKIIGLTVKKQNWIYWINDNNFENNNENSIF